MLGLIAFMLIASSWRFAADIAPGLIG